MWKMIATLSYCVAALFLLLAGTLACFDFAALQPEAATDEPSYFFVVFVVGLFVVGTVALLGGAYASPTRPWKRASGGVLLGVAGYVLFTLVALFAFANDPAMETSQRGAMRQIAREEGITEAEARARMQPFFESLASASNLANGLVAVAGMTVMGVALLRRYRPPRTD